MLIAGALTMTSAMSAQAQDQDAGWYARVAPVTLIFDTDADISIAGNVVPGASASIEDNWSLSFEVGKKFQNNWALSFTGGIPPTAKLVGTGPLVGTTLGKAKYAPAIATAHYHFDSFGPQFEPYLGGGLNYTFIYDETDGAVSNLKVDDTPGLVLVAGVESKFNQGDRKGTRLNSSP